jgi:hypothetical protein
MNDRIQTLVIGAKPVDDVVADIDDETDATIVCVTDANDGPSTCKGGVMGDEGSQCEMRWWSSNDACPLEPGEHACRRIDDHQTHLCDCGVFRIPAVVPPQPGACGRRWSEGRSCTEINHVCQRDDVHDTHVCTCLATDTPTRAGVAV